MLQNFEDAGLAPWALWGLWSLDVAGFCTFFQTPEVAGLLSFVDFWCKFRKLPWKASGHPKVRCWSWSDIKRWYHWCWSLRRNLDWTLHWAQGRRSCTLHQPYQGLVDPEVGTHPSGSMPGTTSSSPESSLVAEEFREIPDSHTGAGWNLQGTYPEPLNNALRVDWRMLQLGVVRGVRLGKGRSRAVTKASAGPTEISRAEISRAEIPLTRKREQEKHLAWLSSPEQLCRCSSMSLPNASSKLSTLGLQRCPGWVAAAVRSGYCQKETLLWYQSWSRSESWVLKIWWFPRQKMCVRPDDRTRPGSACSGRVTPRIRTLRRRWLCGRDSPGQDVASRLLQASWSLSLSPLHSAWHSLALNCTWHWIVLEPNDWDRVLLICKLHVTWGAPNTL